MIFEGNIADYPSATERIRELEDRNELLERLLSERDGLRQEARALLVRMVKYVREDRATTPGVTRLARLTDQVDEYLKRTHDPRGIPRGEPGVQVWLVPVDPAEVVAELRARQKRAAIIAEDNDNDPFRLGRESAWGNAADLVAEKLGVK